MRVLIADDNQDCLETLAILLTAAGHAISKARDGEEAVEQARRMRPDAAILDIGMPSIDGFEAARRIRRANPGILLVAYSGYQGAEYRQRGIDAGFDYYFGKFEFKEVLVVLGDASTAPEGGRAFDDDALED